MQCFPIISKESNISQIVRNNYNGLIFDLDERSFMKCVSKYLKMTNKNRNIIIKNAQKTVLKLNKLNIKISF